MFTSLFTNTLLCLSLTCLIIGPKVGLELDLFKHVFSRDEFELFLNILIGLFIALPTGVEERGERSNWLRRRYWIWYTIGDQLRDESLLEEFLSVCLCVCISWSSRSSFSGLSSVKSNLFVGAKPVEQPYFKPLVKVFHVSIFPIVTILPSFKLIFPLHKTLNWRYGRTLINWMGHCIIKLNYSTWLID